jgi:hypothetical protein
MVSVERSLFTGPGTRESVFLPAASLRLVDCPTLVPFMHAQRSSEALSLSSSIFFGNTRFPSRTCLRLAYSFSVRNLRHHVGIVFRAQSPSSRRHRHFSPSVCRLIQPGCNSPPEGQHRICHDMEIAGPARVLMGNAAHCGMIWEYHRIGAVPADT